MGSLRVKRLRTMSKPIRSPEVFSACESLCRPSYRTEEAENVVAESVKLSSLFRFISSCLLACVQGAILLMFLLINLTKPR